MGCPVYRSAYEGLFSQNVTNYWPATILFLCFSSYFLEYGANFVYVSQVSSVAFSITDIVRRILTIAFNAAVYGYPLTFMNTSGIVLSLTGALLYSLLTSSTTSSSNPGNSKSKNSTGKRN